jgi:hypothetical protein
MEISLGFLKTVPHILGTPSTDEEIDPETKELVQIQGAEDQYSKPTAQDVLLPGAK